MTAQTRYLTEETYYNIYSTFIEAYSDYPININYLDEEKFKNRCIKNGVDLELSVGTYDGNVLVGFVLAGTDEFEGAISVFADTVGLIPEYRGRGHTKRMFEKIFTRMEERGIKKIYLEVLKENKNEINTYKKMGFKIRREFNCMVINPQQWDSRGVDEKGVEVFKTHSGIFKEFIGFQEFIPSWEASAKSIGRIPDPVNFYLATVSNTPAGLLVFYPAINWIMLLLVKEPFRNGKVEKALLNKLCKDNVSITNRIRFVNINSENLYLLKLLADEGFVKYASHYEMLFEIV